MTMSREECKRLPIDMSKKLFEKLSAEMELISNIRHNGEKGHECEEVLKNFLKEYLPKKYSITSGFVYTSDRMSNQSDILVYDENNYPVLFSGYANKVIYYESLKANIECTTLLTAKKIEVDNEKFNTLEEMYDKKMEEIMENKKPLRIVFAYNTEITKEKVLETLNNLEKKNIDILFCAKCGLFIKNNDNTYVKFLDNKNFHGKTAHGYTLTLEDREFHGFITLMLEKIDQEICGEKLELVGRFLQSSLYVDYE